jgi:hypothetical protein
LNKAARDARFDRAERHCENFGNFIVGVIFQVEERDRGLINLFNFCQSRQHLGRVRLIGEVRRNRRQLGRRHFVKRMM